MNIVLLGYPGSGKTTQAKKLASTLGLAHVSFGDIFRGEIERKTPLGFEVMDYLSTGRLAPDWLVLNHLKDRFAKERLGFMFDGFPRTMEQAEGLETWLASRSSSLTAAFLLKLPEAEALKRAAGRRHCGSCGTQFNTATQPPMMADLCDNCGGKLSQRVDDRPEILKRRIMSFHDQTEHLVSYYNANAEFAEINAMQPVQGVFTQIALALKKAM